MFWGLERPVDFQRLVGSTLVVGNDRHLPGIMEPPLEGTRISHNGRQRLRHWEWMPCGYGAKHSYGFTTFTHVGERSASFASASLCFISLCYYVPSTSSRDGMNKASRRRIDENRPEMFQSLKLQSKWWNWYGALLQGCVWQLQGEISTVPFVGEVLQDKKSWCFDFLTLLFEDQGR